MFEIEERIKLETNKCDRNFKCLDNNPSCRVESCVGNSIVFLEKLERHCNYYQEFGFSYVCKCPVRLEIYKKYKV